MTASDQPIIDAPVETNRDRVRRLLLAPLGFRFKAGTDADEGRKTLDRIADDVAYLDDGELAALRGVVQTKGEGTSKVFWPSVATFRGWAEAVRPRPLAELPALVSWFGSVEGPRARENGTLVALWGWFEAKKVPPYKPEMRAAVAQRAAEYDRRLTIIADRRARGVFNPASNARDADDHAFGRWYAERAEFVDEVLTIIQEQKTGSRP